MKEFETHRLNAQGMQFAAAIGEQFDELLNMLEFSYCHGGDGRCLAIAKTKLEEACFFAKKSMACNPANQEPK